MRKKLLDIYLLSILHVIGTFGIFENKMLKFKIKLIKFLLDNTLESVKWKTRWRCEFLV